MDEFKETIRGYKQCIKSYEGGLNGAIEVLAAYEKARSSALVCLESGIAMRTGSEDEMKSYIESIDKRAEDWKRKKTTCMQTIARLRAELASEISSNKTKLAR